MINKELERLSVSPRDLRKFGLLVGGVLLLLGGWFLFRHKPIWPYLLTPGVWLVIFGLVAPRSLKRVYLAWMGLGFILGSIVSTIILTVFYYLVVTPIGLVARLCGQDFLSLKSAAKTESYWILRDASVRRRPAEYEQQF